MKKIKNQYIILIVAVLVIFAFFCYLTISYVYARFLITQPVLTNYNESDRQILQEEMGIEFVENTIITESKYSPGVDTAFYIVFTFPEDKINEFIEGIADNYIYASNHNQLSTSHELKGTFIKGYDHRTNEFTSLDMYKSDSNTIIVYIIYGSPNGRLIRLLMDQVR